MPGGQNFNFQKNYEELENLVKKYEHGNIDLDQGLKDFAYGMQLAEKLKVKLTEVENKIVEIKRKFADPAETRET